MPSPETRHRLFPPAVLLLSFASFFNDVATELLTKIGIPFFLVAVLGSQVWIVGLVDGTAETVATFLQFLTGWWADRTGRRRPFVIAGYALSNLTKPLLYFVGAWWQVLLIRVADRAGKGLRVAPRDALIAEITPVEQRGRAFGLNHALDPAGAMLSLLAGALIVMASQDPSASLQESTFRNLVLFIVLPGLITVILVSLVPESPRPVTHLAVEVPRHLTGLGRSFWCFAAATAIFALANSTDAFIILHAGDELHMSLPRVFVMWAVFNLLTVLCALPSGWLSDHFGRKRFLAAGWIIYGGVYLGLGYATREWHAWCLIVPYGVYYGLTEGVSKALVADLVPAARRGTAYGILSMAEGALRLPANLLFGLIMMAVSKDAAFVAGGLLSLTAAAGLLAVRTKSRDEG